MFLSRGRRLAEARQSRAAARSTTFLTIPVLNRRRQAAQYRLMQPSQSHRHPVTEKRLKHVVANAEHTTVRKNVTLGTSALTVDLYDPRDSDAHPRPWVLFVNGMADPGATQFLGCAIKEMASFESWGRAAAACGLVGVTHTTGADPAADLRGVWSALTTQGHELGLAPDRGALWACSSHVPNGLGLLLDTSPVPRAAVFCYGFMLDLDGAHGVAEAQRTWRFANPAEGRQVGDLMHVPTLVVRAGLDATPHVNVSIDAFVHHTLQENFPLTVINHASGAHAFDLDDDSPVASLVVSDILTFLVRHTSSDQRYPGVTAGTRDPR